MKQDKMGLMIAKYSKIIPNLTRVATFKQGKTALSPRHGDAWSKEEETLLTADFKAKVPLKVTAAKFADKGWGRSYVALWQHRTDTLHLTGRGFCAAKGIARKDGECKARAQRRASTDKESQAVAEYALDAIKAKIAKARETK